MLTGVCRLQHGLADDRIQMVKALIMVIAIDDRVTRFRAMTVKWLCPDGIVREFLGGSPKLRLKASKRLSQI